MESAATHVCREGGVRVGTNVLLRDLDLVVLVARVGRRLEIIADGLPLFGGVQLAMDAALGFTAALRRNGPSSLRLCGWSSFGSRPHTESTHLSGACGRLCWLVRSVVRRDESTFVGATPCESQSAVRAQCHETASRASLALEVRCSAGVCICLVWVCAPAGLMASTRTLVVHDFRCSGSAD